MSHVVLADVKMEPISDENPLPLRMGKPGKDEATRRNALKISKESDDFIFDETWKRGQLEVAEAQAGEEIESASEEEEEPDSEPQSADEEEL